VAGCRHAWFPTWLDVELGALLTCIDLPYPILRAFIMVSPSACQHVRQLAWLTVRLANSYVVVSPDIIESKPNILLNRFDAVVEL